MISERLQKSQDSVRRDFDPNFHWLVNETAPWTAPTKPLAQSTIALLTSCGIYRVDTQLPFDAWNHLGDPSFREIHIDTPRDRLRIAHTHFSHDNLEADLELAIPIGHFQQLEQEGVIGKLYPWVYSFMGYIPEPKQFVEQTAPVIVNRLKQDVVDAALLTPC